MRKPKSENTAPVEKKPRTIDPAIADLREKHKYAVANLRKEAASAALLERITKDLLPKLTISDTALLLETIAPK